MPAVIARKISKVTLTYAVLLVLLLSKQAVAQVDKYEQQALRNADSDGSAIAVAVFCSFPDERIRDYKKSLMLDSMNYAKQHNIAFVEPDYIEFYNVGYMETQNIMRLINPTAENREKNCAEVDKKIKNQLRKTPVQ